MFSLVAAVNGGSVAPAKVSDQFDVRRFGAVGDGKASDSPAIQRAVDAAAAAGGGIVHFGAGTYRCVGIILRSHVTLQLDAGALLQGPGKVDDYPKRQSGGKNQSPWSGAWYGVVSAEDATDIAIIGAGRIDGDGAASWNIVHAMRADDKANGIELPPGGTPYDRPRLVQFANCQRVSVSGITLSNSQMWTLVFNQCQDIQIDGLTITAPADSPETDGIDIRGCHRARIQHCNISNGDDNVAITGARRVPDAGQAAACEDVEVSHCTFGHGHGVSIGSLTANGVRNVRVHDCTFDGDTNGIRIKSLRGRGGEVSDIHFDNLRMTNCKGAITFNAYYVRPPETDAAEPVNSTTPWFHDIEVSHLTATCPGSAGMIVGLPERPMTGITLTDVTITAQSGLVIRDADVMMHNVQVKVEQGPAFLTESATIKTQ